MTAETVTNWLKERGETLAKEEQEFQLIVDFFEFLQGVVPSGMQVAKSHQPKMSQKKAGTIIWFLQEHLHVLPDNIEQCVRCGDLFNQDKEGDFIDAVAYPRAPKKYRDGHVCEECSWEMDYPAWEARTGKD